ncbi:MAG: hypothetical protein AAF652_03850 [Cyanobacteria bacterium P01_C01_bin.72]
MDKKKLIWLGSFVTAGIVTCNSVLAQTNQSDTSGGQTFSSPAIQIDSQNGNGIPPTTQFNPATGEVIGGGIDTPVRLNATANNSGKASGVANQTGDVANQAGDVANQTGDLGCSRDICINNDSQPREVTLNEVADALNAALEKSLDNLAAAENNAQLADAAPRKIARRSAVSDQEIRACVNPVFEAQDLVERQLAESEKFIEQVNQIEPQKNIW